MTSEATLARALAPCRAPLIAPREFAAVAAFRSLSMEAAAEAARASELAPAFPVAASHGSRDLVGRALILERLLGRASGHDGGHARAVSDASDTNTSSSSTVAGSACVRS